MKCPCCGAELELREARNSAPARTGPGNLPPQPWTVERARAFVMPVGKYRGRTIGQIGLADPAYLEWCAETMDRNVGKAAKTYLEHERVSAGIASGPGPESSEEFSEF